jgi:hypothetical protein
MIRLLYISHAAPIISDEQVQDILLSSRRNNSASSITGILIHGCGLFMQVLEGPEQDVLRKYVKILDDPRHSDAQILYISPANDRIFEKWSMGASRAIPCNFNISPNCAPAVLRLSSRISSWRRCASLHRG